MDKMKTPDDPLQSLDREPSQAGEIISCTQSDAVFGEMTEKSPNYRNVGWLGTTALMIKTQLGLGVLSIPSVFHALGLIPGILLLLIVAGITTWSDYMIGVFKVRHSHVYGIDDVGELLFGTIGREVFGAAFCLYFTFVSGSAMLGVTIALNALSEHAICTAIFMAIAAAITFSFSSIQTLGRISWLAWGGAVSITIAVSTVTIAVGVQNKPAAAPQDVPWASDYKLFNTPSFAEASPAISSLVFAYAGTSAFFPIVAEMRDPKLYTRALFVCQTVVTLAYVIVGIIVYYYCGSYVSSPALGSAGPLVKRVSYGIALPGLLITAILLTHIPAKHVFVRLMRGSKHLTSNSVTHWAAWLGSTLAVTIIAYVVASAIPIFGGLVSLIGALLGTFLSFQPMGCMWLYDNWGSRTQSGQMRWWFGCCWSIFVIVSGSFLMVSGTYGSVQGIIQTVRRKCSLVVRR